MLTLELLFALMAYAFVMSITPGPNNLLLLSSGLNFGLRRTGWHMAGILCGTLLLIGVVGAGLGLLFAKEPAVQIGLKLAGSVYMLWLARQLWRASEVQAAGTTRPIRFNEAVAFQFVNPKAWLMATTVIAAFVPAGEHYAKRVVAVGLVFATVALPCIGLWAVSGGALRVWIQDRIVLSRINRAMAALAAATVIPLWI